MDSRIWDINDSGYQLVIKLYRKYEYGLKDSLIVLTLLMVAILIGITLLLVNFSLVRVLISMGLFILLIICTAILIIKWVAYQEVQEIRISNDTIYLSKKSRFKNMQRTIPRSAVTHLRLPGVDYGTEALVVDYVAFPIGYFFPQVIGDKLAPAFYLGHSPVYFFEFGTKPQQMWMIKYLHRYLFN